MKRSIAVISSLLLITHALAMPINAIASQTVDVKEEMLEDSNLPLDNGVKENESSKEEASGGKEAPSTEEKKDDVEEDVITEDDTEEDESSNEEEDITTEDGSLKDESNNIDNDVTEDKEEDLFDNLEEEILDDSQDENLTYGGTIQVDGTFLDWKDIPHTDISYYSPDPDKIHQGALYLDGDILYGHFRMNDAYRAQMVVSYMELTINNSTSVGLTIQKGAADNDIDWSADMYNLPQGINIGLGVFYNAYPKYFMGEAVFTVYESDHSVGDEVEFAIDLNVISMITGIPVESMREIKLHNPNLGNEAIVLAGSSSGAVLGVISMAVIAAGGVFYLKRRRTKSEV